MSSSQSLKACRDVLDAIVSQLAAFAEECAGEEALIVCVDHACSLINDRIDAGALKREACVRAQLATSATSKATTPVLKYSSIWCALR
jgi:hypothetical protein